MGRRRTISIHALRVEGDLRWRSRRDGGHYISIHALRVEGDIVPDTVLYNAMIFLSTPSGWRATLGWEDAARTLEFLSTPSGWRATRLWFCSPQQGAQFLSTPSGWRATNHTVFKRGSVGISIHALRVEGDFPPKPLRKRQRNFYPRPPGGGRQQKRTKFSSVFAQKGEEFASLRRGKRKICRWRFKKDKFWVLIWCEGSGKSVCALASHCG